MTNKSKWGFTLIELVVVMAIVIILALIIITNIAKSKGRSRDQKRIADLNYIAQSMAQYNAQYRSYLYWEMTGAKRGIFNRSSEGNCTKTYPCIYDATSGSSWRVFIDDFLKSRPVAPKKGEQMEYFYNAQSDTATPPQHFAVGAKLESNNYSATKYNTDPWYTTGYCKASECLPKLPITDGWVYVVGG